MDSERLQSAPIQGRDMRQDSMTSRYKLSYQRRLEGPVTRLGSDSTFGDSTGSLTHSEFGLI